MALIGPCRNKERKKRIRKGSRASHRTKTPTKRIEVPRRRGMKNNAFEGMKRAQKSEPEKRQLV